MAASKPLAVLLLLVTLAAGSQVARSQNCSDGLRGLTTCAPYALPGANAGTPSSQCCSAIQAVNISCLCSTLRIISLLPAACKLPAVNCPA